MKLGVHENYQGPAKTSFARTVASFPRTEVTREFEAGVLAPQDLVKRLKNRCGPLWDAGKVPVWSYKPDAAATDSGRWEPYVTALGQYIKDNGLQSKVIVCIWHEPENDFKNAADFVRMYNRQHGWLKAVDPGIITTHAALGYYYRNISVAAASKWVTKCDIHSIDIYSGRSFPLAMSLADSKPFQTWKASRPAGSKWGVSERGWIADAAGSAARVASINAESEYLAQLAPIDQPDFYIVWNTEGVENDPKIILDQAGTDAVNAMFERLTAPVMVTCPTCNGTGTVPADKAA